MRVLGLDIGSKRVGIAISDELGFTAQGLDTLMWKNADALLSRIATLVDQYGVSEIVVGMPYNMNGSEGPQAVKIRGLMQLISDKIALPVREWDERLSTVAADRALLEADLSRAKRKKLVDKIAAVLILQGYLDRQSFKDTLDV
ncbi:MAG: Holliday junction resolvase RuvX [Desulfomonile tiedjei]|nr:Holliday junction resolvase RuvX [Desulfomonile tiedjei]